MTNPVKLSGQVYTPDYLVELILDEAGYRGESILGKHCMENSCGDGAFLCEILRRYCEAYRLRHGSLGGVEAEVATYIHGIETDLLAYECCLSNMRSTAEGLGLGECAFDIRHADTLTMDSFDGRMDYVVGNPPYVRVHNLESNFDAVKRFSFANGGMTDLYLVFFEIGFRMLRQGGRLCYITPSSWINSLAGLSMRQSILLERTLVSVIDLGHYQPFKATTYTMISLFVKGVPRDSFEFNIYDPVGNEKIHVDDIPFGEVSINGYFYLADRTTLGNLAGILTGSRRGHVSVKNGFATLADKVFIAQSFPFDEMVIPTIKASTGKWYKAFFPYDRAGKPLSREQIFSNPEISAYLTAHKGELLKGATEVENPQWYLFGRTQALKDVAADKIAINNCIKDVGSIKLNKVPAGQGVYSGLYILTDRSFDEISEILLTQQFIDYIASLKKYKSGGYYTFNSNDLEAYLNYKIDSQSKNQNS